MSDLTRNATLTGAMNEPAPPDVPGRIPPFRELTGKHLTQRTIPQPTDVTVLTRRNQRMRYWTDGSLRHDS